MNEKCIYFVEGSCEKQLIDSLKQKPGKLIPGKVKVFNPVQNRLPKSLLLPIQPGTIVVLVFDTDKPDESVLSSNISLLTKYCCKVRIVNLLQVMNIEDELVRSTDVKSAPDLTKSSGVNAFKSDFCKLPAASCRNLLERHHIDVGKLWCTPAPAPFDRLSRNETIVKIHP